MPKLIQCKACGKPRSSSAKECLHCGDGKPAARLSPCRACGSMLERKKHRKVSYSSSVVNGSTRTSASVSHIPCSHCGDPQPTPWKLVDSPSRDEIVWLMIIFGVSAPIVIIMIWW